MTWEILFEKEFNKPYFKTLVEFLNIEDQHKTIFPPSELRLNCFKLTPLSEVKVVMVGQDPYHDHHQAHGLSFSVEQGIFPPSLKNIFKELSSDLNIAYPKSGNLTHWAKQGVLLLNTVLTVEAHKPLSHKGIGWEKFTLEVIKKLNEKEHVVFILWGAHAQKLIPIIDTHKHHIIKSVHPSPLSSYRGFFGSKPFSQTNQYLKQNGLKEIEWKLD